MVRATEDPPRSRPTSRHLTSPLTVPRELRRCRLAWRLPPTRSHGGSQGFKSPHLHPQHRRSERRQRRAAALTACCGRSTAASASRSPAPEARSDQATRPWASQMTTERSAASLRTPARLPMGDPRAHPANPGRPPGRPSHAQPPPTTTAESKPTPPLPSRPALASTPGPTRASDGPAVDTARRPRPSQPCGRLPTATLHDLLGRTQGTREPTDTGHPPGDRTPDTWTLRRPHRTLDSGRVDRTRGGWTSAPDTGHRTLAEEGHADEGTAGIRTSWAATPSGRALGHPTVFLWTAPAALGNHDGSAVGHLPARDCLSHDQAAARSLCRPSRASAHCCPETRIPGC